MVRAFVERCRQVNGRLNAIVEDRFAAAIEEAKRVDASLATGEKSVEQLRRETPLLGLPVTVKEACKLRGKCVGRRTRVPHRPKILPPLRPHLPIHSVVRRAPQPTPAARSHSPTHRYDYHPSWPFDQSPGTLSVLIVEYCRKCDADERPYIETRRVVLVATRDRHFA